MITRSTIWLNAGDFPYIDLEIKGLTTFMNFSKSLTFYTPTHKTAIWLDMTPKQAKEEDGMDLNVRPWSWWIILDGISEISCVYSGAYKQSIVTWFNGHDGSKQSMLVTNAEAAEIYNAVKAMVARAVKDAAAIHKMEPVYGVFKKGPKGILSPGGLAIKYRVQGIEYKHHGPPAPAISQFAPSFQST